MLSSASLRAQTPATIADSLVKAGWVFFDQQTDLTVLPPILAGHRARQQLFKSLERTLAILATGDGKSPETAWIVVVVPDEYLVMSLPGYQTSL